MSIRNGMPAADLTEVSWRKSRRSGPQGGNCVEVANLPDGQVAMRNSRHPAGPALVFTAAEWAAFLGGAWDEVLSLLTNVFLVIPALPLLIVPLSNSCKSGAKFNRAGSAARWRAPPCSGRRTALQHVEASDPFLRVPPEVEVRGVPAAPVGSGIA